MNTEKEIETIKNIDEWFSANKNNIHKWTRSTFGIYLKQKLIEEDHWRGKSRGDPQKGYETREKNKLKQPILKDTLARPNLQNNNISPPKSSGSIQPKKRINSYSSTENYDYEPTKETPIEEEKIEIEQKILSPLEVLNSIVPKELIQGPPKIEIKKKNPYADF